MFFCLLVAWLLCYAAVLKGVESSGKAVYVTSTMPYVLLTVLVIKGCSLEGAGDGIRFYLLGSGGSLDLSVLGSVGAWGPQMRERPEIRFLDSTIIPHSSGGCRVPPTAKAPRGTRFAVVVVVVVPAGGWRMVPTGLFLQCCSGVVCAGPGRGVEGG